MVAFEMKERNEWGNCWNGIKMRDGEEMTKMPSLSEFGEV